MRIHSYRHQGWPDRTPRYLGRPYTRRLARRGDLSWLVQVVTDPRRHEWMLATRLTDAAALAEILETQQLLLEASEPDLSALGLVAVERYRLSERNAAIPDDLPALWVGLGQLNHGQSLALSVIDTDRQARALIRVAEALAAAGWPERAGQLGRSITDAHWRAAALTEVAGALAAGGQVELATRFAVEAEQVGRSINDAFHQAEVLSRLTETWVAAGKPERAEQVARSITSDYQQTQALTTVVEASAAAREPERAEQVARRIRDPRMRRRPCPGWRRRGRLPGNRSARSRWLAGSAIRTGRRR